MDEQTSEVFVGLSHTWYNRLSVLLGLIIGVFYRGNNSFFSDSFLYCFS